MLAVQVQSITTEKNGLRDSTPTNYKTLLLYPRISILFGPWYHSVRSTTTNKDAETCETSHLVGYDRKVVVNTSDESQQVPRIRNKSFPVSISKFKRYLITFRISSNSAKWAKDLTRKFCKQKHKSWSMDFLYWIMRSAINNPGIKMIYFITNFDSPENLLYYLKSLEMKCNST